MKIPSVMRCLAKTVGVGVLAATLDGRANLLLNGGFESPALGAQGIYYTAPTSWILPGNGAIIVGQPLGNIWPPAYEGNQFMDIGGPHMTAVVSQAFSIPSAGLYELSWIHAGGVSGATMSHVVSVLNNVGVPVKISTVATSQGAWAPASLVFPASPGSYSIQFSSGPGDAAFDTLIDSVSLVAVPDSETYPIFAGLSVVGFALWRRYPRAGGSSHF